MKKTFLCLLVIICLIVQAICAISSVSKDLLYPGLFMITVHGEEKSIDTSHITIDVYSASVAYAEEDAGYYEYSDEYSFSVETDSNGIVAFEKPSDAFAVVIQLDTLPEGCGIEEHTHFFLPDAATTYSFNICRIATVDAEYDDENVTPVLYSKDGKVISADSKATIVSDVAKTKDYIVDDGEKTITYADIIEVTVQGSVYEIEKSIEYKYRNDYDKTEYLFDKGLIEESEYIDALCEYKLTDKTGLSNMDGTALYWTIKNYCNKKAPIITDRIKEVLKALEINEQSRATSYEASNNGHFRVYYDTTIVSAPVAKKVANEFQAIDTLFYTNWGFLRPFYNASQTYYCIYLVNTTLYSGETPLVGTEGSYINISYTTAINVYNASGITGYPDAYKGDLAHEYMHAILYRYQVMYDTAERKWMHESFATWAGMVYKSDFGARAKGFVDQFLNSPSRSLDYFTNSGSSNTRHYGSCVFPLCIYQNMGGYSTIKKILSSYSPSNTPISAVVSGLTYYGYNLGSAFSGCAGYNYNAGYFYNGVPTTGTYAWGKASVINKTNYPSSSPSADYISRLACKYIRFVPVSGTSTTLTVTINFSGTTSGTDIRLKSVRETSGGDNYITNRTILSNMCTMVQTNFGSSSAAYFTIVPINGSNSGTITYIWSASTS